MFSLSTGQSTGGQRPENGVKTISKTPLTRSNRRIVLTVLTESWYSPDMAINLPPDLEQSVRRHISSGQYHSAEDVLRAALHQFDEMDLVSLKQSADDEKAGRVVSLQSAAASIRQKNNFSDSQ